MECVLGYRFRIYPSEEQRSYLERCFGCARLVYNQYVNFSFQEIKKHREDNSHEIKPIPKVSQLKKIFPFLTEVDSLALANTKLNFQGAWKNYFDSKKGKRKGKKSKPPKFKKKGKCKDSFKTNNQNGTVSLNGDLLKIPKLKEPIRVVVHRPLPQDSVIKSVTITKEKDGTFYASLTVLCSLSLEERELKDIDDLKVVGLDMSMEHLVVPSNPDDDVNSFPYRRHFRKMEKKLKRAQRKLSRRLIVETGETRVNQSTGKEMKVKENSKNREKQRVKVAKIHRKIANQRKDCCMQKAAYFAKKYDVIVVEDLNMQAMSRTLHLGKSVSDVGFGMFRNYLDWQCLKRGSVMIKADKWFASSKTCSDCGSKYEGLRLSDREWVCPMCGCIHDRDLNAAVNLKQYGIDKIRNVPQERREQYINACGDSIPTIRSYVLQMLSEKQESSVSDDGSPSL